MSSPVTLHPMTPSTPDSTRFPAYKFPAVDRAEAFPVLTAAQIARFREAGRMRKVELGEILFEPGQTNVSFFVLLSGSLDIVQPGGIGLERAIATHHAGAFTGEMTMISNLGSTGCRTQRNPYAGFHSPTHSAALERLRQCRFDGLAPFAGNSAPARISNPKRPSAHLHRS